MAWSSTKSNISPCSMTQGTQLNVIDVAPYVRVCASPSFNSWNRFGNLYTSHTSVQLRMQFESTPPGCTWSNQLDMRVPLQGNMVRIDRNMSDSRRDKWQKVDKNLSKVTESWQKMSELTVVCPKWQKYVNLLSFITSWFGHVYVNSDPIFL